MEILTGSSFFLHGLSFLATPPGVFFLPFTSEIIISVVHYVSASAAWVELFFSSLFLENSAIGFSPNY